MMGPARDRLAEDLRAASFRDLSIPLVTNVDARLIDLGSSARDALVRQVCAPVRWVESIELLLERGVEKFVEVGPGKVLSGLVKKIAPRADVFSVEDMRSVDALASSGSGVKM
jgi:[acyl-carrier-protein] S-malonyltransferase